MCKKLFFFRIEKIFFYFEFFIGYSDILGIEKDLVRIRIVSENFMLQCNNVNFVLRFMMLLRFCFEIVY